MNKKRLPPRRVGYNQKFIIDGVTVYLRTGEYEDGTLGEIFISTEKTGSFIRSMMDSFCIAISIGLQYGAPLEDFADKFIGSRFAPSGIVQLHSDIKMAGSILDAVFKDLSIHYLKMDNLKQGG